MANKINQPQMRSLSLQKGIELFVFKYEIGQESKVLDAMAEMANSREFNFDWFDAAVISHQIGEYMSRDLKKYVAKKSS